MQPTESYTVDPTVQYGPLQVFRISEVTARHCERWYNESLCRVNTSLLRLGRLEDPFPMHTHDDSDELFFVLEGTLRIETETNAFTLRPMEGLCIPKGVLHRPVPEGVVLILMVEQDGLDPLGSAASPTA